MNIPGPVLDRMIATNHPRVLATTKSCPLLGIGVRSSGSGESLTRVRLLTSLIDKNCDKWSLSTRMKGYNKAAHVWSDFFGLRNRPCGAGLQWWLLKSCHIHRYCSCIVRKDRGAEQLHKGMRCGQMGGTPRVLPAPGRPSEL